MEPWCCSVYAVVIFLLSSSADFIYHHLQRQFGGMDEEGGLLLHVSTKNSLQRLMSSHLLSPGNHTQSLAVLH